LLGHLCFEILAARDDITTIDFINYSNRTTDIWESMVNETIDIYWEYTGTLWHGIDPRQAQKYHDLDVMYQNAVRNIEENYPIEVLSMAPFNNSYGLVTTQEWVSETGIESISDFGSYLNAGNTDVVAGVNPGPYSRKEAWEGMIEYYDVRDEIYTEWNERQQNVLRLPTGETYARLLQGTVDVVLGFTSDAQIEHYDLAVLADDASFWSAYSPAPVVQEGLVEESPEIRNQLDQLGPAIGDVETMRRLSAQVLFADQYPGDVAQEFLREQGFL
jgi:osmoprotectant transport system substrate-binding protein